MRHGGGASPGGTGKTFAFLDLGAGIATGTTWLGTYACTKGKVGVFLGEEDDDEAWRRLWHITQRMTELELYDLERNLVIMGLMGQQVALMQRGLDGNVTASPWFRSLYESLAAQGPWRALLFDPWSRWGGAEAETDAYCATIGISLLESLTFLPGRPAVIVAHHTRKMTPGASHDANDTRGSSAFVDGTRMVANLFRQPESDLLELRVTKANYTLPGSPLVLTRDEGGVLRPATPVEIQEAEDDREQRREEREERKREKRKKQRQTRQENTL